MNNNLWWIKRLLPMRHDGVVFDAWEGKYHTFQATRREMIRLYIRLYRTRTK